MQLTAVLESQKEGGYTAYIPALPGCVSEGETLEEAKKNLLEALRGYLLVANKHSLAIARRKHGKAVALKI
ncbi:MAG: type II toxin-antitoxin system HicB family antitoxin [Elusimicrobia bacterium]|nr:type II toxin-antitoxin system HicB family antitoxin [Elusimicrobiota bacterium]